LGSTRPSPSSASDAADLIDLVHSGFGLARLRIPDPANTVTAGASEPIAKTPYSTQASVSGPLLANVEDEATQARYLADHGSWLPTASANRRAAPVPISPWRTVKRL